MLMALSSLFLLVLTLNPSYSLCRLSYPNLISRVHTKPRSIQAIRLSWTHINPTAHNDQQLLHLHFKLPLQLASASPVLFLGFRVRICSAGPAQLPLTPIVTQQDQLLNQGTEQEEDEKLKQEFENWKSKTNDAGEIDPRGKIYAAPYGWGTVVIAYKKSKFRKHNLAPIEDSKKLCHRSMEMMALNNFEVYGSIIQNNIDLQVAGGKIAVQLNLALLANQAFGIGDVWVAVGWSSDVLPAVKHMSNVAVVPKSGASLWADLWAIPAASRLETKQIGGRVRGPSPLIHQWIEFCLQTARALPFKQEVIPGTSPSALESTLVKLPGELLKGKPSLDTNLIAGVPPAEILARCDFLEPLSEATLSDYEWLVANLQKPAHVLMKRVQQFEKKDHGANATDFFIIVASLVEVSSFEAVYAYAVSLLKFRKLKK
ncbi:spermidine/putrescine-binding periplasmic protein [Citrus sinensis]|nr:spermidine/putrescine-binding periplasmic protein [Citrus sinensis]